MFSRHGFEIRRKNKGFFGHSTTIIFCLISSAKCFAVGDGDDNGDNGDGGNTSALNFITLFLHFSLMLLYR